MAEIPDVEAIVALNKVYQVYTLAACWVEAVLYGLYLGLFTFTIRIMTRKQALDQFASRVFLMGVVLMFLLITIHNASVVYKMIRAYALYIDTPPGLPVIYFQDYVKWDNYVHPVTLALLTWLGDYLAIYRCFLIWRRNWYVIIVPSFLLLVSLATTSVNLYWFKNPESIPWETMGHFLNVIFPVNLVQNIITTGLIAFKIGQQYRHSRSSGLMVLSSTGNLLTIIRIIVESALIYTTEMFVMIILFYKAHPGLVIVQHMLNPSIGIVFTLIAVRVHVAKTESISRNYPSNSAIYQSWMSMDHEQLRRPMPIVTTITEEHRLDNITIRHEKSDFGPGGDRITYDMSEMGPTTV